MTKEHTIRALMERVYHEPSKPTNPNILAPSFSGPEVHKLLEEEFMAARHQVMDAMLAPITERSIPTPDSVPSNAIANKIIRKAMEDLENGKAMQEMLEALKEKLTRPKMCPTMSLLSTDTLRDLVESNNE